MINALHITGQSQFSEARLIAVTQFAPGRMLGLADLRLMAVRITDFYNAHGYIVAQAYVPAQDIKDGAVTIAVVEGRYGAVKLNNRTRLRDGTARAVMSGLTAGAPVTAPPLERRLLLLSDIPGVQVRSTLSPGTAVGTSDLLVDLTPGHLISGNVEADNEGNPYTGIYQGGGTLNINNPLGLGDVASVRVLTSGSGVQYVRGSYQVQVGQGTIGGAFAYFHYRLGRQFAALDADGTQQVISGFASYPLIRSYTDNLHALVNFDHRKIRDKTGVPPSMSDRVANVGTFGFYGDHHDTFHGGGWDSYSVYGTVGNLDIQTAAVRALDATSAHTQGGYAKLNYSIDRLQTVAGPFSLYGAIRGQEASKNLDITEKMELGGAHAVRAYPEGEGYGDDGYVATAEGRLQLPRIAPIPGQFQLAGFYDHGWVRYDHDRYAAGRNSESRSGIGASLTWADNSDFLVRVTYAHTLGSVPATSLANSSGQFWFEVVKYF